jgi:hypothetical protein
LAIDFKVRGFKQVFLPIDTWKGACSNGRPTSFLPFSVSNFSEVIMAFLPAFFQHRFFALIVVIVLLETCALAGQTNQPLPFIDQPLVPASAAPGGPGFNLVVNGSNFMSNSVVTWNGSRRNTHFMSHSRLSARIDSADIAVANTAVIAVVNPAPGGGTSNRIFFPVRAAASTVQMQPHPLSEGTTDVAVGDFNHDGKLDLAVVSGYTNVSGVEIFLGEGGRKFRDPVSYPTSDNPTSVAVGDLNGDGNLDLVLANGVLGGFSILLGNSDGTFQTAVDYTIESLPLGGVALGDFNRDGKLDVAASTNQNGLFVLLGNGDGSVGEPIRILPRCCNSDSSPLVGDFNGDGILDIEANNNHGSVASAVVLIGTGDGTFQQLVTSPSKIDAATALAADFNGDGILDFTTDAFDGFNDLVVLLGTGGGAFSSGALYFVGGGSFGLGVGDFNGDGKLDLVCANNAGNGNSTHSLSVLLGNGDGTFRPALSFPASSFVRGLAVGDFTGDGKLGVAVASSDGVVIFLQSD